MPMESIVHLYIGIKLLKARDVALENEKSKTKYLYGNKDPITINKPAIAIVL